MKTLKVEQFGDEFKITEYRRRNGGNLSKVKIESDESVRFENNISRARSRIFELAACNEWEYFATLTLRPEFDRANLDEWKKKFSQWLRDYRKKGFDVKYLLVPEQHKDGAWHMHGFFSGIGDVTEFSAEDIGSGFTASDVAAYKAALLNREGNLIWKDYSRRWGYCTLSRVRSREASARYITKYVTKSLAMDNLLSGAHLFYASRGLESAKLLALNAIPLESDSAFRERLSDCKHFCNEFIEQWWTDDIGKIAPLVDFVTGEKVEFTFSEK